MLRQRAGRTVRDVARSVRLAPSTVGDYFSGRHLPPVRAPELLTGILRTCGVEDHGTLELWHEALVRVRMTPGRQPAGAVPPYRGLRVFDEEHAEWFFGRDELTAALTFRLSKLTEAGGGLLPVVGASGSGKSSLLRAGLIPAVRNGTLPTTRQPHTPRPVILMTPGESPAEELTARLAAAGPEPLVVVDQFEELFTSSPHDSAHAHFIALLTAPPVVTVIGLRADFYPKALLHPALARALQDHQVVMRPMSTEEMRQAVTGPARKARLEVESGLVELLLRDLAPRSPDTVPGPAAAHEPGTLPLLSHALHATWQRAERGRLTVAAYRAGGGIHDAVARTAEAVFSELPDIQREIARQIFLRLVHVTDDAPTTRRRVARSELVDAAGGARAAEPVAVLAACVEQRLITVDQDTVEISHESLLTAWPRLREWIDTGRGGLRIHRRLTEAARGWEESGRDPGQLLRGTALAVTREWAEDRAGRAALNTTEHACLDASTRLEETERRMARQRTRRLAQALSAALALLLIACGLSLYARHQRDRAERARTEAVSRALAAEADRIGTHDLSVSAQLALAAYRTAPTHEARAALMDSSAAPTAARITGFTGLVQSVTVDRANTLLAAGSSDGTVRLWSIADRARPRHLATVRVSSELAVFAVALSPDGRTLVAGGGMGLLRRWDVADARHPRPLPALRSSPDATVYSLAFAPDGRALAAAGADRVVRVWPDARAVPTADPAVLRGSTGFLQSVAFSPDGTLVAAAGLDGQARLWRVRGSGTVRPLTTLDAFDEAALAVGFSPDGRRLAVGSQDRTTRVWDISRPEAPRRPRDAGDKATSWINAVGFSPGGDTLAIGGSDDAVRLWDLDAGYVSGTLPHPGAVTSLTWIDRKTLVTGCSDGTVRLWNLPSPVLTSAQGVNALAYSPDSRFLAVGTLELHLWDLARHERVGTSWKPGGDTFVQSVAFSPGTSLLAVGYGNGRIQLFSVAADGTLRLRGSPFRAAATGSVQSLVFNATGTVLATGADDATVRLWDVRGEDRAVALRTYEGATDAVLSVAFSPDGRHLAAGSIDRAVRIWAVDGAATRPSVTLRGPTGYVWSVAFSPDGGLLAAGSADRTVRLWSLDDPNRPVRVGPDLTGFTSYVYSVAFSPDGRTLAAGSTDSTVWLFGVTRPHRPGLQAVLTAATGHVYAVAFSPDGRTLAAGGEDHTVRLWSTDTDLIARRLCAARGDPLSAAEWRRFLPTSPRVSLCT
ncbi:helix-turn-helix domain-containing protein [Streptomyces sp. NPDC058867]|uniref:nSTAND1 domain-containing NTPase n=1 Tax=unclassified Streptomyces TaxID=2593676 RepID=UPI0036C3755B